MNVKHVLYTVDTADSEVVYVNPSDEGSISTAAYCLLLTGVTLDLSSLLSSKKFRTKGGKEGALAAMRLLQSDGLGTLTGQKAHRGVSMVSIVDYPFFLCT